jgi:hypothetical protein
MNRLFALSTVLLILSCAAPVKTAKTASVEECKGGFYNIACETLRAAVIGYYSKLNNDMKAAFCYKKGSFFKGQVDFIVLHTGATDSITFSASIDSVPEIKNFLENEIHSWIFTMDRCPVDYTLCFPISLSEKKCMEE